RPPRSTLFPYTTLFPSTLRARLRAGDHGTLRSCGNEPRRSLVRGLNRVGDDAGVGEWFAVAGHHETVNRSQCRGCREDCPDRCQADSHWLFPSFLWIEVSPSYTWTPVTSSGDDCHDLMSEPSLPSLRQCLSLR